MTVVFMSAWLTKFEKKNEYSFVTDMLTTNNVSLALKWLHFTSHCQNALQEVLGFEIYNNFL